MSHNHGRAQDAKSDPRPWFTQYTFSCLKAACCELPCHDSCSARSQVYSALSAQIVRVQAPWIKACHMVDNRWYVIPNFETVILGGTAQQGDWNADFSEEVGPPAARKF